MASVNRAHQQEAIDRVFDSLSHPSRRQILYLLSDSGPPDTGELDLEAYLLRDDTADPLRIELIHSHLPKLDQWGYIEWDRSSLVIRRGPDFDEVAPVIEIIDAHRDELALGWP